MHLGDDGRKFMIFITLILGAGVGFYLAQLFL